MSAAILSFNTTNNLPIIPGGKKLVCIQFNMPMTSIENFGKMKEKDPFFKERNACCKKRAFG